MEKHYTSDQVTVNDPSGVDEKNRRGEIPGQRAAQALAFARRCLVLNDVICYPPHLERPGELARRVGRRVASKAHMIYGYVRQAVRQGGDGLWIAKHELGELVDAHPKTVQYSLEFLERVKLLVRIPQYAPPPPELEHLGLALVQLRTAYGLGELGKAAAPRRMQKRRHGRGGGRSGPLPGGPPVDSSGKKSGKNAPPTASEGDSLFEGNLSSERVTHAATVIVRRGPVARSVGGGRLEVESLRSSVSEPESGQRRDSQSSRSSSSTSAASGPREGFRGVGATATSGPLRAALLDVAGAAGVVAFAEARRALASAPRVVAGAELPADVAAAAERAWSRFEEVEDADGAGVVDVTDELGEHPGRFRTYAEASS